MTTTIAYEFNGHKLTDRMAIFGVTAMLSQLNGNWIVWTVNGDEVVVPKAVALWLAELA